MPRIIISDTSCFIILTNIGELDLLRKVYGEVTTTVDIANEFGEQLPEWVKIRPIKDKYRQQLLEMQIDKGESSAITLALETQDSTLILDDGTLGVIIKAKLMGIIPSIKPLLNKINKTNFRVSADIELQALREAKEKD